MWTTLFALFTVTNLPKQKLNKKWYMIKDFCMEISYYLNWSSTSLISS